MSDTDTAAPTAHDQMMEAHFRGDQAGAQGLSAQVNQEAGIEQPQVDPFPLRWRPWRPLRRPKSARLIEPSQY